MGTLARNGLSPPEFLVILRSNSEERKAESITKLASDLHPCEKMRQPWMTSYCFFVIEHT